MGVKVREKEKGSGAWWIYINHKGARKAMKFGRDKKEANKTAKKIEARLVLGDVGLLKNEENNIPTFKKYIEGWEDVDGYHVGWFKKVAELRFKNSTKVGYRNIIHAYLIPAFGSKRLDEINARMITDFVYKKYSDGLRYRTIKNIKNCLSRVLTDACKQENYITSNPARGITITKPEDEKPAREADPFTWEEKNKIEDTFKNHYPRYFPLVLCGLRTGLRIGELIALKWEDIDFYNKLILVQRNITRGKITTPKSASGRRYVRMTSQLVVVLKRHRNNMKEEKFKKGWHELSEWVFYNEEGNYIDYDNFLKMIWNKGMEKSELRRRTPHDLRHTYATLRLSKGDSLAEVSKEMGHSNPQITYEYYYKWLPKESVSNIDELDEKIEENATIRNLSATRNEKGFGHVS